MNITILYKGDHTFTSCFIGDSGQEVIRHFVNEFTRRKKPPAPFTKVTIFKDGKEVFSSIVVKHSGD